MRGFKATCDPQRLSQTPLKPGGSPRLKPAPWDHGRPQGGGSWQGLAVTMMSCQSHGMGDHWAALHPPDSPLEDSHSFLHQAVSCSFWKRSRNQSPLQSTTSECSVGKFIICQYHLPALGPWASCIPCRNLSFSICEMGVRTVPTL